jgi:hypothetical protein
VATTQPRDQDPSSDAVSPADLAVWDREFAALGERITPLFYRPESQEHAVQYLRGLLSPLQRKNGWVRHEAPCDEWRCETSTAGPSQRPGRS